MPCVALHKSSGVELRHENQQLSRDDLQAWEADAPLT